MPPLTPVVKNLLFLNIIVFALAWAAPQFLGVDLGGLLALYYPTSEDFLPVQLLTHFFMHGGLTHIFFNMFGLVMFGPLLEHRYGPQRFLFLYLFSAMTAVALHFGYTYFQIQHYENLLAAFREAPSLGAFTEFFSSINTDGLVMDNGQRVTTVISTLENDIALGREVNDRLAEAGGLMEEYVDYMDEIPMVGASGALYGVVAAFAILYPDFKLMLIFLPIPIRARYFVPIILAGDLFLGIMNYSWDPIAHFAHLGGAIGGGLLAYIWYKSDPPAGAQRWDR